MVAPTAPPFCYNTNMKYKNNTILYAIIAVALGTWLVGFIFSLKQPVFNNLPNNNVACTADAKQCSDGSYVGRSGPNCEFVCPTVTSISTEIQAKITAHADLITLTTPLPNSVVANPLLISGSARGNWYFEGSFPIVLTNWDGLIIAEGHATALGDWMTEDFVPFSATLEFTSPYPGKGQDFMKRGSLILKKDNPSGLPENDDALEIPIQFIPND